MGKRNRGHRFNRTKTNKNLNDKSNVINHQTAGSYDKIIKENKLFEKYYKETGIVPANEWDTFIEVIKEPLPIAFRITSYKNYTNEILNILKDKHFKLINEYFISQKQKLEGENVEEEGKEMAKIELDEYYKPLSWYPDQLAWQVNLSRSDVRKNEKFQVFKQFLIDQTESGNISRQEAVSMIPPLVLDVKPHHKVLDMCAAPGSKTAQLIELLHADGTTEPEGFVVANDIDNKRCYMLVHQLKRLESPNFMIVNHDSSVLPNIRFQSPDGQLRSIFYDRILCDVPCSGDGTFRKNVDIWKKWNFAHAANLHGIQCRIASRAVELLAPAGLMVYSTCSLNPIENEAVICNLLLKFKGQIELVDPRSKLPGLKTMPGLQTWKLMSKEGEFIDSLEQVDEKSQFLLRSHMFPPDQKIVEELKIEKCVRILPHHQNTGGFFVALIRKLPSTSENAQIKENNQVVLDVEKKIEMKHEEVSDIVASVNSDDSSSSSNPPDPTGRGMKAAPAKRLKHVYDENPFRFCVNENELDGWPIIQDFFGIKNEFPLCQLMMRNRKGENVKNVYFVSKNIHDIVELNGDRIKFINMGVRLFSKADLKDRTTVELKICQEGIDIVEKYFTKRILHVHDRNDFYKLLIGCNPDSDKFTADFQRQIKECNCVGSIIITCHDKNTKYTTDGAIRSSPISFTGWLGKSTVRPFLNISSRKFLLTLLDIEDSEIDKICAAVRLQDQINTDKSKIKIVINTEEGVGINELN